MLIVGFGGTLRPGSSTERVLFHVLRYAKDMGAETLLFVGDAINLPMYVPNDSQRCERTSALVAALRKADAVVIDR